MYDTRVIFNKLGILAVIFASLLLLLFVFNQTDEAYGMTKWVGERLRGPVSRNNVRSPLIVFRPFTYRYQYYREEGETSVQSIVNAFRGEPTPTVGTTEDVKSVPVLLYHGIVNKNDRFSMTEAVFRDQMFALKRSGYHSITLEDFLQFRAGKKTLPPKPFLLTFDDGRVDSYRLSDPLLKALNFKAVMFVASGASVPTAQEGRSSYYILPGDIHDMIASGRWEIGSHAVQEHGGLIPLDAEGDQANFLSSRKWIAAENRLESYDEYLTRITYELTESKKVLKGTFGIPVQALSYPFGDYGLQTKNVESATAAMNGIVSSTYTVAFRQVWPDDGDYTQNYADSEAYHLKRVETPTDWNGDRLVAFLETARDKNLPFQDDFSGSAGWQSTWGTLSKSSDGLSLTASATSTGADAFLDGARAWTDYDFRATVQRLRGSHISLAVRYQDVKNYTVCTYGQGRVKIDDIVDGHPIKLSQVDAWNPPAENAVFSARATGDQVACAIDGITVVSATISGKPKGGIGFRIWDERPENAEILVKNVLVTPLP